jgi:type IV pilus assembly protein PilO
MIGRVAGAPEPFAEPLAEPLAVRLYGAMLRLLPNKTEIEGLLIDISQSGLAAGLEFQLFKPGAEQPAEFYAVQPINISVTGTYHQFGEFISAVAALPRIVTQHDLQMAPLPVIGGAAAAAGSGKPSATQLRMNITAKTYRYLDEDEIAAEAEKDRKKGKRR